VVGVNLVGRSSCAPADKGESVDKVKVGQYKQRPLVSGIDRERNAMNPHRKTYSAKQEEVDAQRAWWVVDATDIPLGRLATAVATKIRGKDKPIFTPHADTGDFVIVVNAGKVKLTGNKRNNKFHYSHSGFPGGLKQISYGDLLEKKPTFPVEKAVKGMLPKNRLGRALIKKLKVYVGPDHPHTAQRPQPMKVVL
jgi:large subunit ribosomal protein L13